MISCAVDNERSATYLALGSFLPLIMLCGIIWPIEGMHPLLKAPALFLPLTKSTESLRSILQRGWPIEDPHVYIGFVSTGIWILIFLTVSILLLKFKKGWTSTKPKCYCSPHRIESIKFLCPFACLRLSLFFDKLFIFKWWQQNFSPKVIKQNYCNRRHVM